MKRLLSLFVAMSFLLSSCSSSIDNDTISNSETFQSEISNDISEESNSSVFSEISTATEYHETESSTDTEISFDLEETDENDDEQFSRPDDSNFLNYIENFVYTEVTRDFNSDDYYVESVEASYVSQEYLDTVAFNSQSNIYFGYTINELQSIFEDIKYVFTLGEDNTTAVTVLEEIPDTDTDTIMKNVAIGSGVILVSVVLACAAPAVGVPAAVTAVLVCSAEGAAVTAVSSAAIGGLAAGVLRGYQTGDFDEALQAMFLNGSEEYKWGAIIGAVTGAGEEALFLKLGTKSGLTMNEVAAIQKETKWSLDIIKKIHSKAEYEIYKKAGLAATKMPDGTMALLREIDWNLVDQYGRTNVQRVLDKLAPIGPDGMPFELHHVGQRADSPLAILTWTEHHKEGFSILHYKEEGKNVAESVWKKQKEDFWKNVLKMAQEAGMI